MRGSPRIAPLWRSRVIILFMTRNAFRAAVCFTYRMGEGSGTFREVTNMQDGVRATWSRIRKEPGGAGLVADLQDGGRKR